DRRRWPRRPPASTPLRRNGGSRERSSPWHSSVVSFPRARRRLLIVEGHSPHHREPAFLPGARRPRAESRSPPVHVSRQCSDEQNSAGSSRQSSRPREAGGPGGARRGVATAARGRALPRATSSAPSPPSKEGGSADPRAASNRHLEPVRRRRQRADPARVVRARGVVREV